MRTIWSTFLKFLHRPLIDILTVGSRLNRDSCTHGNGRYCKIVSVNSFCGDILGWNRTKGNSQAFLNFSSLEKALPISLM